MDKLTKYKALRVHSIPDGSLQATPAQIEIQTLDAHLPQGQVIIRTEYSSVNYKDALAVTGKGKILRQLPLTPGIDVAGTVYKSNSSLYKENDSVLVNGCGLGETQDGGFSEFVTVDQNYIVPLPSSLSPKKAMTLGTAGFTAALAVYRMEVNGQNPDFGPILVTGASGGVGMAAIQILNKKNYKVVALSHKKDLAEKLLKIGATKVINPSELDLGSRPLESVKWGGAIDNLGGKTLSGIARQTQLWGNIACIGLAESSELHTTVMPMILRGVSFLGISSANCPMPLRKKIWNLLAEEWHPQFLDEMVNSVIKLEDIPTYSERILNRETHGRALVHIPASNKSS